jgi:hypothetical protein
MMEKTLGERLREYAKKSYKNASDISGEMKFVGLRTSFKAERLGAPNHTTGHNMGARNVRYWLSGKKEPSGKSIPIVEDYLRRMKA